MKRLVLLVFVLPIAIAIGCYCVEPFQRQPVYPPPGSAYSTGVPADELIIEGAPPPGPTAAEAPVETRSALTPVPSSTR